jgi:glycerol-3-phosphate acyltransferase PlsY
MLIAYLVGSIPTGYLVARFKSNTDLRAFGSGSTGATNVFRAAGKLAALLTLIIDMLKGYVSVTILPTMLYTFRLDMPMQQYCAVMGLCAIIGHNWPVFLRFKGGKGIATSAGVLLGVAPALLLLGLCVWVLVFIFSKIVSLSSIIAAIAIPIVAYIMDAGAPVRILTIVLAFLTILRHHGNIKRLVKKEEKKIVVRI